MNVSAKPGADWRERLLAERARRLAERPAPQSVSEVRRVCLCECGDDLFGIPVDEVARVIPAVRPAPLANAATALLGVIARNGRFALIYDLSALLGGSRQIQHADGHFVLLRAARPAMGLHVARMLTVTDIAVLTSDEAQNLPVRTGVSSYGRLDERIVSIVDIHALVGMSADANSGGS